VAGDGCFHRQAQTGNGRPSFAWRRERDLLNRQRSWYIAFTVSAFSLSGFGNGKDVA